MNCLKKYNGIVVHARLYSLKFCKIILFFIIFITILYLCMGTIFYKNISPSAPRGIYMIAPNQNLDYGDFVVVKLPVDVPILNVQKGYPMIKKVQGLPGDVYRVGEDAVEIHGRKYKIYHMNGLPQNNKIGEHIVLKDEILFLNDPDISFDLRYLGTISLKDVEKKVILIFSFE